MINTFGLSVKRQQVEGVLLFLLCNQVHVWGFNFTSERITTTESLRRRDNLYASPIARNVCKRHLWAASDISNSSELFFFPTFPEQYIYLYIYIRREKSWGLANQRWRAVDQTWEPSADWFLVSIRSDPIFWKLLCKASLVDLLFCLCPPSKHQRGSMSDHRVFILPRATNRCQLSRFDRARSRLFPHILYGRSQSSSVCSLVSLLSVSKLVEGNRGHEGSHWSDPFVLMDVCLPTTGNTNVWPLSN